MEQLLNPGTLSMLIPIVAIIGAFVVKIKKMEMQRNSVDDYEELQALRDEVISLRRRMEHVEAIVTTDEHEPRIDIDDVTDRDDIKDEADRSGLKNMLR